ncbi:MAG: sigma-54 dependent transcriptional regulator [Planctomycetota bacterium]
MTKILLADSDPLTQAEITAVLEPHGHVVQVANDGRSAYDLAREGEAEVLLAELDLPGIRGIELTERLRSERPDVGIILMAAFGSVEDSIRAMKVGAMDFLTKPFTAEQVLLAVERAIETGRLQRENQDLRSALDDRLRPENMIGTDARMQEVFKIAKKAAETDATVLITGESGTGKTLLARAIHANSARRKGPFVEVHCGGLAESLIASELFGHVKGAFTGATRSQAGKFEAAQHGTIFLDEIGTVSKEFQIKLLRVLQDRVVERVGSTETIPLDVRVIVATNLDLARAVEEGTFREDLYYRIDVVPIRMPALRERRGDIPFLADHFLRRAASRHGRRILGFDERAMRLLVEAPWPGNVRQLENVVERAVVLGSRSRLGPDDLPSVWPKTAIQAAAAPAIPGWALDPAAPALPLKQALEGPEKAILEDALRRCNGNREAAAKLLQINRSTLFNKLRKYGIK